MRDFPKEKTYNYKIYNKGRSPINTKNTWWVTKNLNIHNMKEASFYLLGKHDFSYSEHLVVFIL